MTLDKNYAQLLDKIRGAVAVPFLSSINSFPSHRIGSIQQLIFFLKYEYFRADSIIFDPQFFTLGAAKKNQPFPIMNPMKQHTLNMLCHKNVFDISNCKFSENLNIDLSQFSSTGMLMSNLIEYSLLSLALEKM